ncbi:3-deoxy-D-manno-octulosonic acid transferase [Rubritalea marina]|uniref:3-deoxy-D-manno-octulosonic acid transferase n=1 Tax=Rubritalea marina TaxID=361055 RepID=UPI00036B529D|nr:glycosyltransferase N-terminal domain-containing protein [Rubritalea marina]
MMRCSLGFSVPQRLLHLGYNLLLPVVLLLGVGPWLLKMSKRGGLSMRLLERVAIYDDEAEFALGGVVYVHAVSVGEVMVALKLIRAWQGIYPNERFLLVPTTSTGYDVALRMAPANVSVVYSPVDLPCVIRRVLKRFEPKQIVLMESELWPNLLVEARRAGVPVSVANARLSERSESRYTKFAWASAGYFALFNRFAVQESRDVARWRGIGVPAEAIEVTGSVKFDQQGADAVEAINEAFQEMLSGLSSGKRVVMALSTHAGEEALIGEACIDLEEVFYVVVPRHAERRAEVKLELEQLGYEVVLRSELEQVGGSRPACLVIDSTGEMRDWVALADLAIVGKSFIGKGGQNPCEAIAASVPVIVGPAMNNFEPLVSMLHERSAIFLAQASVASLRSTVSVALQDRAQSEAMVSRAQAVLSAHDGATLRTVEALRIGSS